MEPMIQSPIRPLWFMRQPVSGLSHLLGAILSSLGLFFILSEANAAHWITLDASSVPVFSVALYVFTMVLLFLSSALYHLLPLSELGIQRLRKLDHSMIYVFIASGYTPFALIPLAKTSGPWICLTVWIVAAIGVGLKLFWIEKSRWLRIAIYLAMSWIGIALVPQLINVLPIPGFRLLLLGGLAYTLGAIVYATRWPDPFPTVFGFHEVWHLFVLLGSWLHFLMMKNYVLTLPV